MRKPIIICLIVLLNAECLHAQDYIHAMGVPSTPDTAIMSLKEKTTLITANYKSLGSSASIKKYCPTPGNQDPYGTCAAWSTAYAARTIIEAQKKMDGAQDKRSIGIHSHQFLSTN